jgi:hypothetical protein
VKWINHLQENGELNLLQNHWYTLNWKNWQNDLFLFAPLPFQQEHNFLETNVLL